jgi:hypothetical protein
VTLALKCAAWLGFLAWPNILVSCCSWCQWGFYRSVLDTVQKIPYCTMASKLKDSLFSAGSWNPHALCMSPRFHVPSFTFWIRLIFDKHILLLLEIINHVFLSKSIWYFQKKMDWCHCISHLTPLTNCSPKTGPFKDFSRRLRTVRMTHG